MEVPDVQYARSGDVAIAYQVVGEGPIDLVYFRGMAGDLLTTWDQPLLARNVLGLAALSRVLMLDKRGTGLSDGVREVPTLETRMDDVRAVMDAGGAERAIIWSSLEGARMAILFAATYPERTEALVLFEPSVRGSRAPDYPWAPTDEEWRQRLTAVHEGWGRREFFAELLRELGPSSAGDETLLDWFVTHMRRSLSPGAALAFHRAMMAADVSDVLPAVRVPTLVLCRPSQRARRSTRRSGSPAPSSSSFPRSPTPSTGCTITRTRQRSERRNASSHASAALRSRTAFSPLSAQSGSRSGPAYTQANVSAWGRS